LLCQGLLVKGYKDTVGKPVKTRKRRFEKEIERFQQGTNNALDPAAWVNAEVWGGVQAILRKKG